MRLLTLAKCLFFVLGLIPIAHADDIFDLTIPLPLTGKQAKFGEIMKHSYEMAADEINAAGGIKGKQIVISFEDSIGKPEIARNIVEKLIDGKKQPLIVGEYTSACAKAIAAVAEERKTPYLIVASADDDITRQHYQYIFRQNVANTYYAHALIDFLEKIVKPKTIAILYESSAYGTSGADAMEKRAKEMLGIEVVLKEKFETGIIDFRPLLAKVRGTAPDVVYIVSYANEAQLFMKQAKELRVDAKLYAGGAGGFAISKEFIDGAKDAAEYVVSATLWTPQLKYPGILAYTEKYRNKFGYDPSYHGASAYSALFVIKNALERAHQWTPELIRDALKTTDMMTPFGPIKFENKEGYQNQNFMPTFVIQVIRQRYQMIWPPIPGSAPYAYPIPSWKERN